MLASGWQWDTNFSKPFWIIRYTCITLHVTHAVFLMLLLTKSTLFFLGLRKSSKKFTLGGEVKSWIADVTEAFQASDLNSPTNALKASKAISSINVPPQSLDTDSTLINTLASITSKSFINQDFANDPSEIFADIVDNALEKSATVSKFSVNTVQTVQVSLLSFNYIFCSNSAVYFVVACYY